MALQVTPVNRNLQTRVTFMYLEFEDLFVVLGAAAVMNVLGHFVGGEVAGMPMNLVLQYGVPAVDGAGVDGFRVRQATRLCPRSSPSGIRDPAPTVPYRQTARSGRDISRRNRSAPYARTTRKDSS